jgi:hypothetical protein
MHFHADWVIPGGKDEKRIPMGSRFVQSSADLTNTSGEFSTLRTTNSVGATWVSARTHSRYAARVNFRSVRKAGPIKVA